MNTLNWKDIPHCALTVWWVTFDTTPTYAKCKLIFAANGPWS